MTQRLEMKSPGKINEEKNSNPNPEIVMYNNAIIISFFIGLTKDEFSRLCEKIKSMRESCNRTIRTAVGIFFTKLRLALSNRVLTTLFNIDSVRITGKIVHQVRKALLKDFVPEYMGVGHISREKVIVSFGYLIGLGIWNFISKP